MTFLRFISDLDGQQRLKKKEKKKVGNMPFIALNLSALNDFQHRAFKG